MIDGEPANQSWFDNVINHEQLYYSIIDVAGSWPSTYT